MSLLTFTQYQENNILFTPVHGAIAILKLKITLPKIQNDKIHLTDEVMILYGKTHINTKAELPIQIILSKGIYSIDQFNQVLTKNKEILTREWKPPQIDENYKLQVPELYSFVTSNLLLQALGIDNANAATATRSPLFGGTYQTTLTPYKPPPKKIKFYCHQIDELSNEIDGQPSTLLYSWDVLNSQRDLTYSSSSNPLIFLQLKGACHHLKFALLDDQNNKVIPESFYFQLYNKQ